MVDLAAQIFRDFNTDGDPGSGSHKVVKSEVREWGTWIEAHLAGAFDADIEIAKASPTLKLNKPASGTAAKIRGQTAGVDRWSMEFGSSTGESGSNAGSNFNLYRHDDAGAQTIAISVNRASGLVTVADRVSLTAGQVTFPAAQNASADANTLDDYEEGTWTPTLSATGCTFSYAGQIGTYTKIGNRVLLDFRVELNTSGNTLAGNALSLTGLPFAAATTVTLAFPIAWTASTTNFVSVVALLAASASAFTFGAATAAGVSNTVGQNANNILHATNGSVVRGSLNYRTA